MLWPPRSPNLNPLDFFLWSYLKNRIYLQPFISVNLRVEDLKKRIIENCLHRTSNCLDSVMRNIKKQCAKCLLYVGGTFEHLF